MNAAVIIPVSVISFLTVVGLFLWWWITKNNYRYTFKVISRDGKSTRTVKAKLMKDPDNPRLNKFSFKDNPTLLSVREPDAHEDGVPIRRLTFDVEGQYVYLEGYKVDEDNFLKSSLKPTAKELAMYQLSANQRRNPIVNKTELAVLISGIILFILILGGVVFMTIKFIKVSANIVEIANSNREVVNSMNTYADVILQSNKIFLAASNNLASYCSDVSGGTFVSGNLSRSLAPQELS